MESSRDSHSVSSQTDIIFYFFLVLLVFRSSPFLPHIWVWIQELLIIFQTLRVKKLESAPAFLSTLAPPPSLSLSWLTRAAKKKEILIKSVFACQVVTLRVEEEEPQHLHLRRRLRVVGWEMPNGQTVSHFTGSNKEETKSQNGKISDSAGFYWKNNQAVKKIKRIQLGDAWNVDS